MVGIDKGMFICYNSENTHQGDSIYDRKKKKKYETIAEFFYEKASIRVKQKVLESKLRHTDILPSDPKQISRIINNNCARNNPYLINESALSTSYIDIETKKYVSCGLIPKLNFNSAKEVLWGTDEEINSYIQDLFLLLWEEVCEKNEQFDSELYLCDFIPYAKYRAYWNILFDSDTINDSRFSFAEYRDKMLNFPALFFGIREDTVIKNIDSAKNNALNYLYCRCKDTFLSEFINYTNSKSSFHCLNKSLENDLINEKFIPTLEKFKPDASSLGIRVKNLILEDLSYSASLIFNQQDHNPKYLPLLINASSDYILKLEKIQMMQYNKETKR